MWDSPRMHSQPFGTTQTQLIFSRKKYILHYIFEIDANKNKLEALIFK